MQCVCGKISENASYLEIKHWGKIQAKFRITSVCDVIDIRKKCVGLKHVLLESCNWILILMLTKGILFLSMGNTIISLSLNPICEMPPSIMTLIKPFRYFVI